MFFTFAHSKSPKPQKPKEKQMRVWDMGGSSTKDLDYSHRNGDGSQNGGEQTQEAQNDLVKYSRTPTIIFFIIVLSYGHHNMQHMHLLH